LVTYLVTDPRSGISIKVEAPVNASKEELIRLANHQYRIQELERISARHRDRANWVNKFLEREEAKEKYEAMAKERRDLMERLSKGSKRRELGAFARAAGQYGAANPLGGIGGIMSAGGVGMDNERLRQGKEESTMLATLHDLQKAGITSGLEFGKEALSAGEAEAERIQELERLSESVDAVSELLSSGRGSTSPSGEHIESYITNDFDGLDYGNIYKLANGQIWEQTAVWIWVWVWVNPRVTIWRDGGSYKMKVENIDHPVGVKRIR